MKAARPPYWKDEQYLKHWSERKKKMLFTWILSSVIKEKKKQQWACTIFFPGTGCIGVSSWWPHQFHNKFLWMSYCWYHTCSYWTTSKQRCKSQNIVFTQSNVGLIKILASPSWCVFKSGIYSRVALISNQTSWLPWAVFSVHFI